MMHTLTLALAVLTLTAAAHAQLPASSGRPNTGDPRQISGQEPIQATSPTDTQAKLNDMATKAIAYLRAQQADAGGWSINTSGPNYPAISALVLNGMLMQPGLDATDPTIAKGIRYVLSFKQPDGGIYDQVLPSYNTAIAISMLTRAKTPEAQAAIAPAVDFLKQLQFGDGALVDGPFAKETGKVAREHPFYGGVGYGRHGRPDGSNLNMFLQAMADANVPADDPAIQRAIVFLERTQMLGTVNRMDYAKDSTQGGFIYSTSVNSAKQGVGQSFAGDIEESLSGPPGSVATLTLANGEDGKPLSMSRDDVRKALADVMAKSMDPQVARAATAFKVLLRETPDNVSASRFEIRTPLSEPGALESILAELAKPGQPLAGSTSTIDFVRSWQGISRLRAYGSMTYAGFKSYLYANMSPTDPRVAAARAWIEANYTLAENPGLGTDGLYYYYTTFSRALQASKLDTITQRTATPDRSSRTGAARDWRADLVNQLATLQNPDGSFRSVDDRWMENNPTLITAYALLALQHARH